MSDDLISRKVLIADMKSRKYIDKALCEIFETVVDEAPTAFDKEKVIEELKKTGKRFCVSARCSEDCQNCEHGVLMKALIEIVKKGGIE